jgi:hypothetical protein
VNNENRPIIAKASLKFERMLGLDPLKSTPTTYLRTFSCDILSRDSVRFMNRTMAGFLIIVMDSGSNFRMAHYQ